MRSAWRGLLLVLLFGCKDEGVDPDAQSWAASDFLPPAGMLLELVPRDRPQARPVLMELGAKAWELRAGDDWAEAEPLDRWAVDTGSGLVVAGETVLPPTFEEGATFDNGVVQEVGEREVWYGTFRGAVTVDLGAGPLSGPISFAEGVGPIALRLDEDSWELAGYTPP